MSGRVIKTWSLLLGLLLLSSCGYRLCNPCVAWPDDVQQVYVSTNQPNSPVYGYLQDNLQQQNLRLVESEFQADAIFVLLGETQSKRLLAVANGNEPAEYELIYRVSYRVDRKNNRPQSTDDSAIAMPFVLGKADVVESRRAQVFNPAAVLAVEREAESLYDEMARYIANQITRKAVGQLSGDSQ